ncbi:hypothetical protein HGM15179_001133, partial [Zosterops borbonicus]
MIEVLRAQTLKGVPGLAEVERLPSLGGLVCISMRTECKNNGTGHSGLSQGCLSKLVCLYQRCFREEKGKRR